MSATNSGLIPHPGAYGFRLVATDAATALPDLISLPDGHDEVKITVRRASSVRTIGELGTERIHLAEERAEAIQMRRSPAQVVLDLPGEISARALVHPLLALPLSLMARWHGHVTLHAGAFESNGAWAILGDRTAGKSSMLAALAERGVPIVSDDLLVVDDGLALAGPSCVDLRPDVAARFPAAESLGIVGGRERFRLATPPAEARSPLRGFFVLEWTDGATPELVPVPTHERLRLLYSQEYMGMLGASDARRLVELVGLPGWWVRRPRSWDATPAVVDQLLEATAGGA
jgi:hypothetical protein